MRKQQFNLSSRLLSFSLSAENQRLTLEQLNDSDYSWLSDRSPSELFAVYVNEKRYTAAQLSFLGCSPGVDRSMPGVQHGIFHFAGPGFEVDQHVLLYDDSAVLEMWPVVRAAGSATIRVGRLDAFSLDTSPAAYELLTFNSDWGQEFEPVRLRLEGNIQRETRAGRSSKGQHPWFALFREGAGVLSGAIAWSGNWVFRFETLGQGATG